LIGLNEKDLLEILYRLLPVMLKKEGRAQIERNIRIVREFALRVFEELFELELTDLRE